MDKIGHEKSSEEPKPGISGSRKEAEMEEQNP
jgi:hypothetical protein